MNNFRYTLVGDSELQGYHKCLWFSARFGEYLLTIRHKGVESTFLSAAPYSKKDADRKAIVEEFIRARD